MQEVENIYGASNAPVMARSTTTEMVVSRQAQEVQAAMVIAKRFPRNEVESYNRIIQACKRKTLAEQAMYEYPRGGTKVTGPSIRLAEAMAQNWGNLDYGIIELEQKNGESQVMAYAWDLETNTRQSKIFSVPHIRSTKKGNMMLTDPRDIYELVANQGARRVRACILGVIPGDVIDSAIEQCNKTMLDQSGGVPLIDLVRQVSNTMSEKYGVTIQMLEKYIGCKSESFTMNDLIRLKKVYKSLEDGMAKREDYFDIALEADDSEITDPFAGKSEKTGKGKGKKTEPRQEMPAPAEGADQKNGQAGPEQEEMSEQSEDSQLDPSFIPDGQQEMFQ